MKNDIEVEVDIRLTPTKIIIIRFTLTLCLISLAIGLGAYEYISLTSLQDDKAESFFSFSRTQIEENMEANLNKLLTGANLLADSYTSSFNGTDRWPNVTLTNFEMYDSINRLEVSRTVSFNPVLFSKQQRYEWEKYAVASADVLQAPANIFTGAENTWRITDGVYSRDAATGGRKKHPDTNEPLVPVWQITPMASNFRAIMFNLYSEPARKAALDVVLQKKVAAMTDLLVVVQDSALKIDRPSAILFAPVFSHIGDTEGLIGTTSVVFSWDDIIASSLPLYIRGIEVVLVTKTKTYTLSLDNGKVVVKGLGDLHNPKHDGKKYTVTTKFVPLSGDLDSVEYKLIVYPTNELYAAFEDDSPLYTTIIVVVVIFVSSLLFIIYDYLMQNRQADLAEEVNRSSSIVRSLFLKFVRERMLSSQHVPQETGRVTKLRTFMFPSMSRAPIKSASDGSDPIAENFACATVLFADVAGFTAWSSQVNPSFVFTLLETLYGRFDAAAVELGVFKVETIGDCYMASTGLPDQNPDHAVIMARFALKMQSIFDDVTSYFSDSLGGGIQNLKLRVGFHSGKVTAGVLRGQKSRFQLFGDTVNTASRMESTGCPGRVQVSESVYELLAAAGIECEERAGGVQAKGKGSLRTWWLAPSAALSEVAGDVQYIGT